MAFILFLAMSIDSFASLREFRTTYFRVIYEDSLEHLAKELYPCMDHIAERQFVSYDVKAPRRQIMVFLLDSSEENAKAFLDTSVIVLLPHQVRSLYLEKNYSSWIRMVFAHELSHVVLSYKTRGLSLGSGHYFPKLLSRWLHEGLAIYWETLLSDGGRNKSDTFTKNVKANLFSGHFASKSHINIPFSRSYDYGASFVDYYVSNYGWGAMKKALDSFSIFSGLSSQLAREANVDVQSLIDNWHLWIKKDIVVPKKVVRGTPIITVPGSQSDLLVDGNSIYFFNYGKKRGLYKYSEDGCKKLFNNPVKCVKDGKLYYITSRKYPYGSSSFLISEKRNLAHVNHKFLFSNTSNIYKSENDLFYVKKVHGKEILFSKNQGEILNNGLIFQSFHSSGDSLFFSASQSRLRHCYIFEYNINTRKLERLVRGENPFFSNGYIYFSSTISGVSNIYRYKKGEEKVEQLTDVIFGAFNPVVFHGDLYYLRQRSNGQSIFRLKPNVIRKRPTQKAHKIKKSERDFVSWDYSKSFNMSFLVPLNILSLRPLDLFGISLVFNDDIKRNTFIFGFSFPYFQPSIFYNHMDIFNVGISCDRWKKGRGLVALSIPIYPERIFGHFVLESRLKTDFVSFVNTTSQISFKDKFFGVRLLHEAKLLMNKHDLYSIIEIPNLNFCFRYGTDKYLSKGSKNYYPVLLPSRSVVLAPFLEYTWSFGKGGFVSLDKLKMRGSFVQAYDISGHKGLSGSLNGEVDVLGGAFYGMPLRIKLGIVVAIYGRGNSPGKPTLYFNIRRSI